MLIIISPAYNEEQSIGSLFDKLEQYFAERGTDYKIIVCNDGSTDKTGHILQSYLAKLPLEIITHKRNRGLGETMRDLMERVVEISTADDIVVRMESDDTNEPSFVLDLVAKIEEGYDVAIASRFQPGGGQMGVSRYRAFISRCANAFMKIFFPLKGIQEYSCGFRAYRASILHKALHTYGNNFIQLKGLGFTCTLEKLIKLKLLGARFAEVPFTLRYDQKKSESKMVSSVTTLGYMMMALLYHWPWGGWRRLYKNSALSHAE